MNWNWYLTRIMDPPPFSDLLSTSGFILFIVLTVFFIRNIWNLIFRTLTSESEVKIRRRLLFSKYLLIIYAIFIAINIINACTGILSTVLSVDCKSTAGQTMILTWLFPPALGLRILLAGVVMHAIVDIILTQKMKKMPNKSFERDS
ncbi:MAG: hypothetical protein PHI84_21580 [Kiritimatiellae bacterium]|nr:hypothetical protein [Kiritimatiellia bacterium]